MKLVHRVCLTVFCAAACSTAAVVSSSVEDAGVVGGDASVQTDSKVTPLDATSDASISTCLGGEFGKVDYSWPIALNNNNPGNGALAATPRGVAGAQLVACPVLGYDIPDGFGEFALDGGVGKICTTYFARSATRALAHVSSSSGADKFLAAISGESARNLALYSVIGDGSSPQNPIGFTDAGGAQEFYANAMVADGAGVHIASESSKLPSHGVALSYSDGSLIKVDYEDAAMKSYLAVAVAPSGTYYAGEAVNGHVGIRRLTAKGEVDVSFGNGGFVDVAQTGAAGALVVDPAGRVIFSATSPTGTIFVGRLTVAGELDATFGGGRVDLQMGTNFEERIGMVIAPDGNVVVGGLSPDEAGAPSTVRLAQIAPDAAVNMVSLSGSENADPANRVALARDSACGYLYAVALGGKNTVLRRVHW